MTKVISFILVIFLAMCPAVLAQTRVVVKVGSGTGAVIPDDFIGESFETASLQSGNAGVKGNFFDSSNTQLVTLFRELGIKSLRIGGASVDRANINPTRRDIDALFRFARAAGVKVIFSLRLQNGDAAEDASIAKYVWDNHREYLTCFSIGNEPDWHAFHIHDPEIFEAVPDSPGSAYPSYLAQWRRIADVVRDSVPEATFGGPNTGSNYPVPGSKDTYYSGNSWTVNFAADERSAGIVTQIFLHCYVGQNSFDQKLTPQQMIDQIFSRAWINKYYPALYYASCVPIMAMGYPYRFAEANSFSGGVPGGSNCFATALFALEYLHWWAAHGCAGVNFHTTQWRYNGTIRPDSNRNYQTNPMGYGMKAFDLGGHGRSATVTIANPDSLNLSAYGVDGGSSRSLTIINKEHGLGARPASVVVNPLGSWKKAEIIHFCSPGNDPAATTGVTLGGATIENHGSWQGKWTPLPALREGECTVEVPASSAAIIKLSN